MKQERPAFNRRMFIYKAATVTFSLSAVSTLGVILEEKFVQGQARRANPLSLEDKLPQSIVQRDQFLAKVRLGEDTTRDRTDVKEALNIIAQHYIDVDRQRQAVRDADARTYSSGKIIMSSSVLILGILIMRASLPKSNQPRH
ncbi:MAG: hypothetical protein Q8R11_01155 [bacterium]|nr:hypothetical protein [bacterium]